MARRAIWRGVLTFSEVRVPVKLYSAVESQRVEFHLLHDQDQVRWPVASVPALPPAFASRE